MNFLTDNHASKFNVHTISIRPEHFNVSSEQGNWKGVVGVSEHLGSNTFLRIHMDNETLTVKVNGEIDVHHGDTRLFKRKTIAHL